MVNSETLKLYTFQVLYWSLNVQQNCSFILASATSAACWGYARVSDQCLTSHWPANIHSIKTQRRHPTSQLADHPWSANLHVTVLDWMKQKILANWPPTTEVWIKRTRNSQSLKRCLARGAMGGGRFGGTAGDSLCCKTFRHQRKPLVPRPRIHVWLMDELP